MDFLTISGVTRMVEVGVSKLTVELSHLFDSFIYNAANLNMRLLNSGVQHRTENIKKKKENKKREIIRKRRQSAYSIQGTRLYAFFHDYDITTYR